MITHPEEASTTRILDRLHYIESRYELAMIDGDARDLADFRYEATILRSELHRRGIDPDAGEDER